MSRSYKKHPWVTDHHVKTSSENKKFANKKVRHQEDLPNRGAFKKVSNSYDICDFKWIKTRAEAIQEYEEALKNPDEHEMFLKKYPTLKRWLFEWKKTFSSK